MPELLEADRQLYRLVHVRWHVRALDPVMIFLTRTGTKGMIWVAIAVILLILRVPPGPKGPILSIAALLVAEGLTNLLLKPSVRRERPYINQQHRLLVGEPGAHSWPSAHASSSMAAGATLAFLYPPVAPLYLLLALLIGYSRVYVGVHYPIDVAAGFVLGLISAAIIIGAAHLAGVIG